MKFTMPGYNGPPPSTPVSQSRRKSPGQLRRDYERVHWSSYQDSDLNSQHGQHLGQVDIPQQASDVFQSNQSYPYSCNDDQLATPAISQIAMHKPEKVQDYPQTHQIKDNNITPPDITESNSTEEKVAETSDEFEKVVVDHRSVVTYNHILGLHNNGIITMYEINKDSDYFHIQKSDDSEYDELKTVIQGFGDVRESFFRHWDVQCNEMYEQ